MTASGFKFGVWETSTLKVWIKTSSSDKEGRVPTGQLLYSGAHKWVVWHFQCCKNARAKIFICGNREVSFSLVSYFFLIKKSVVHPGGELLPLLLSDCDSSPKDTQSHTHTHTHTQRERKRERERERLYIYENNLYVKYFDHCFAPLIFSQNFPTSHPSSPTHSFSL